MNPSDFTLSCPAPLPTGDRIVLSQGGGGTQTDRLIESVFKPEFTNPLLDVAHDGAVFQYNGQRLAMSTDTYVVRPLQFPGGDIGKLAVYGTINDLAMCGAQPLYLSAGFVLEEGLSVETLRAVVKSVGGAARDAGVPIVTADTKVVERGKADGLFINTSGVGVVLARQAIEPSRVKPGDVILVSGDIGRHGIAVMAVREGLAFETTIESDTAPLAAMVQDLIAEDIEVHCLRDATRGGLGGILVEVARASAWAAEVLESDIPVREDVRSACELLGLDPLFVACEGRFAAWVPAEGADWALEILRRHPAGQGACVIGRVLDIKDGSVRLQGPFGGARLLEKPSGEQLPRIC